MSPRPKPDDWPLTTGYFEPYQSPTKTFMPLADAFL